MIKELFLTILITSLIIVLGFWIQRNRDKYQSLYKYRFVVAAVIYFTLLFLAFQGRVAG